MKVEQIYTSCLAQGSYYIHSNGEAAIIDPLREVSPYIERAQKDGVKIKYIFETHFHADFVSGHVTLAQETGATIIYGPLATPKFDAHIAKDGELFELGNIQIKVLHTPGHTMESSTFLLLDESGEEHAIFSGDTLFLGDVGRPDLAQKATHMTQEDLAGILYDSLREKIMVLPNDVIVYPAHGAGSACGKNMMKETVDTLGNQKKMNYALRANMTKKEFVKEVTDGLLPPPSYFPLNVKMNKQGYDSIDKVIETGTKPLTPKQFKTIAHENKAIMLDVRKPQEFAKEHIPNSIFIGLDGSFAPWVGELIVDVQQPILLIVAEGREEEAVTRLSRVGFDCTLGFLQGGIDAWKNAGEKIDTVKSVPAIELEKDYNGFSERIFDLRKTSEFQSGHIKKAHSIPLSNLVERLPELPKDELFYMHCAGGYRSMIAASILKSKKIHNLIEIQGGYKAIKETNIPKIDLVCPSAK